MFYAICDSMDLTCIGQFFSEIETIVSVVAFDLGCLARLIDNSNIFLLYFLNIILTVPLMQLVGTDKFKCSTP